MSSQLLEIAECPMMPTAAIAYDRDRASLCPDVPEARRALTASETTFAAGQRLRTARAPIEFFESGEGNCLLFPVGHIARVREFLERSGYSVEVSALRPQRSVDYSLAPGQHPAEVELVRHTVESRYVVHCVDSYRERLRQIALLAAAIPQRKSLVIVPNHALVKQYVSDLRPLLIDRLASTVRSRMRRAHIAKRVIAAESAQWLSEAQVAVTTFGALRNRAWSPERPILFVADARVATHEEFQMTMKVEHFDMRVGFLDQRRQPSQYEQLSIEHWLGTITGRPAPGPHVSVMFVEHRNRMARSGSSGLLHKRKKVWSSALRNRRIGGCVVGFRSAERPPHVLPDSSGSELFGRFASPTARIIVLVESLEHARNLHEFLAGSTIVAQQYTEAHEPVPLSFAGLAELPIVTVTAGAALQSPLAQIVIRADGGHCGLESQLWLREATAERPILIVDVADRGDLLLERAARHRCEAYRASGYQVIAPDWLSRPPRR